MKGAKLFAIALRVRIVEYMIEHGVDYFDGYEVKGVNIEFRKTLTQIEWLAYDALKYHSRKLAQEMAILNLRSWQAELEWLKK